MQPLLIFSRVKYVSPAWLFKNMHNQAQSIQRFDQYLGQKL